MLIGGVYFGADFITWKYFRPDLHTKKECNCFRTFCGRAESGVHFIVNELNLFHKTAKNNSFSNEKKKKR